MGAQRLFTIDNIHYNITHSTSPDPLLGNLQIVSQLSLEDSLRGDSTAKILKPIDIKKADISSAPPGLLTSMMVCSLCANSTVSFDQISNEWNSTGDPTEVALVVASMKSGFEKDWLLSFLQLSKVGEFSFDSDRKLMSTIYSPIEESKCVGVKNSFVFCKGAPESVLKQSVAYISPPQKQKLDNFDAIGFLDEIPSQVITEEILEYISNKSAEMASSGLRVLALAMKKVLPTEASDISKSKTPAPAESNLIFIGLVGLIDPPKQGVKESVRNCKQAGIRVVMITGDHIDTAKAIAKELGIIDENDANESRCMKGYEIDMLSEESLSLQRPFPVVFARVSPDNKLKIVKALQRNGESVVMTGDGVNDAPAIKQADVGVSMGISGTEITKQAASIILADDNFSTIVEAVREGRNVYDNIIKFLVYLLSCNASEVLLFLLVVLINYDFPFTANQLLWANIFAGIFAFNSFLDVPPAMSLGVEPQEPNIMIRKPRNPNSPVMSKENVATIISQATILTCITLVVYILAVNFHLGGSETLIQQQSLSFAVLISNT